MTDYNSLYQQGLYLSPDQQDLLLAALSSNNPPQKNHNQSPHPKAESDGTPKHTPSGSVNLSPSAGNDPLGNQSGGLGYGDDESPFLDFNPDVDFDFQGSESLIGDIPGSVPASEDYEPGDKRKDMDGKSENENEESGKKRRESDGQAKKPGRKPLTSEPTSVSSIYLLGLNNLILIRYRSARLKIGPHSGHSVNARRSISKTWKPKWKNSRKHLTTRPRRMVFCVRRWHVCRSSSKSIASVSHGLPGATESQQ